MKIPVARNAILSGLGLMSLLVYVLACTSFSPDDSKVLFPAFDAKSGATSAMVYDRKTGNTEQVFIAVNPAEPGATNSKTSLLRPQWLPDGTAIVIAWQAKSGDDPIELTLVPFGVREPVRTMRLADSLENALLAPFPIIGSQIFLAGKQTIARLDTLTGAVRSREFTNEPSLYPDPEGKKILCWSEISRDNGKIHQFGAIDPDTLAFEPSFDLAGEKSFELATFAFGRGGNPIVLLGKTGDNGKAELRVIRNGKLASTRQVELGAGDLAPAPLSALSPRGDCLYTSYTRHDADKTHCEYGLLEVPVTQGAPRLTRLIQAPGGGDESEPLMFQGGLSHDGRAWAAASPYLWAQNDKIANGDCGLFLVDLTDAKRKVTKVAIPVPANRRELFK